MTFFESDLGQLVIDRPGKLGLQTMADFDSGRRTFAHLDHPQGMTNTGNHCVPAVELECDLALGAEALRLHLDSPEGRSFDIDFKLFDRCHQDVRSVRFSPEYGREQPHHGRPVDGRPLVIPGAVAGDSHLAVAAALRIPLIDGRQAPFVNQLLQIRQADTLQSNGRAAFGHSRSLLRCARDDNRVAMQAHERTAIVTGAGKRVGAVIAAELLADGWSVVAHVHHGDDVVPDGATKVVAELTDLGCANAIFGATGGLPPVTLLVNNAARFSRDGFGEFSPEELDAHMAVNLRAPILLTEAFARRHAGGEDALIVNLLDSKLVAPNPDFLSYTLSKQALAGFTELSARALAGNGIRVNGIAPALMLRSAGQSRENYERMHRRNPLKRGAAPADVVSAIRYFVSAQAVTGQVLVIDGGEHFSPPGRDVQFLES